MGLEKHRRKRDFQATKTAARPKDDAALPDFVRPQLATLVDAVPHGDDWLHEIKFDGYRVLCRIENRRVVFLTREGHDWTHRFNFLTGAALDVARAGRAARR